MNTRRRVLLLVGSARRPRSTSESLGSYLCEKLGEHGFATQTLRLSQALKTEKSCAALLAATDRADILVVAFPLYADSLPYLAIKAMERIAEHRNGTQRQGGEETQEQHLVAIANCGFPEAHHNDTAIAMCRQFARQAGFEWAGGLTLGGGPALNGQPLSEVQGQARNAIQALDLTAAALATGQPVPGEARRAMAKSLIPNWAYTLMGGLGWRWQARKNGVRNLDARPYKR